jgi:hypothetical protein
MHAGAEVTRNFGRNLRWQSLRPGRAHSEGILQTRPKDGKACGQAGGGYDSEPEAEFQETVNQSKAMLKAVALAETFAKFPWHPRQPGSD